LDAVDAVDAVDALDAVDAVDAATVPPPPPLDADDSTVSEPAAEQPDSRSRPVTVDSRTRPRRHDDVGSIRRALRCRPRDRRRPGGEFTPKITVR
jgi:hypothetical protein